MVSGLAGGSLDGRRPGVAPGDQFQTIFTGDGGFFQVRSMLGNLNRCLTSGLLVTRPDLEKLDFGLLRIYCPSFPKIMDSKATVGMVRGFNWWNIVKYGRYLERETGIEPATNGLGSRYSTIELLPLRI